MARKRTAAIDLPPDVRVVTAKGKRYYYYQRGRGTEHEGPRISLGADPFHPDFAKKLLVAKGETIAAQAETAAPKSVAALFKAYKASPEWTQGLSASTHRSYEHYLKHMEEIWGRLRADQITPAGVLAYRDKHKARSAKTMLSVGRTVFKWGIPRGYLTINPFADVSPVSVGDKGHWPWPAWAVEFVMRHAPQDIRRFIFLGVETGQRSCDLLRLSDKMVESKGIWTSPRKTRKTYKRLFVPLSDDACDELFFFKDGLELTGGRWRKTVIIETPDVFVLSPTGRKYTTMGFRSRWNRWLITDAGKELMRRWAQYIERNMMLFEGELDPEERLKPTLHGLRSTAVVRRRMAGYQPQQIANDIGMSMPMVLRYSRFMDQREAAENNIILLNERIERRKTGAAKPVDRPEQNT